MIKLYIYDKKTGLLKYEDTGLPNDVVRDISDDHDFTLEPYPMSGKRYRWDGSEWVEVDKQ